jgi:hypothetical protein
LLIWNMHIAIWQYTWNTSKIQERHIDEWNRELLLTQYQETRRISKWSHIHEVLFKKYEIDRSTDSQVLASHEQTTSQAHRPVKVHDSHIEDSRACVFEQ